MSAVGSTVDVLAIGTHPDDVELSCGGTVAGYGFVVELTGLDGRAKLGDDLVMTLVKY